MLTSENPFNPAVINHLEKDTLKIDVITDEKRINPLLMFAASDGWQDKSTERNTNGQKITFFSNDEVVASLKLVLGGKPHCELTFFGTDQLKLKEHEEMFYQAMDQQSQDEIAQEPELTEQYAWVLPQLAHEDTHAAAD